MGLALNQPQQNRDLHLHLEQVDGLVAAAGVDGAREILDAFHRSTADLLEALGSQLREAEMDAALATAHAVKGSAANVGAKRLAETAARIEQACRNKDHNSADGSLKEAHHDFEAFQICFSDHLARA